MPRIARQYDLVVRSSGIHAAGVFSLEPIPKGARVLEYTGARMPKDIADKLYENRDLTYLFGVGDQDDVIDGFGTSMFVNHSCDPNCETEEIDERVWIVSCRSIPAGEELTYDYFLYDGEGDAPCTCGSANCRESMYSPKELKRRAKKKNR